MDLPLPVATFPPLPSVTRQPPVMLTEPRHQAVPLVFASPHSGRVYPDEFVAAARLDPVALRRSEDSFVDELFAAAPSLGAPLLTATFPRAFCDPNREPWELDPAMFDGPLPQWVNTASPRVGAGLGTIARVVASGESIYRRKLSFADAEARIRDYWQPFHDALSAVIETTRQRFGWCLLIDCHSMPASSMAPRAAADFVLGDVHGTTCGARATRLVEQSLDALGYTVRRNDPYAGGYITRTYGRPHHGVHALQIEICRTLYMDEVRIERLGRFVEVQRDITALIRALAEKGTDLMAA